MATVTPAAAVVRPTRLRAEPAPRKIRVPKGEQPAHSELSGFQQWCWRTFKDRVQAKPVDPILEENLLKAHVRMRGDEYMAFVYGATVAAAGGLMAAGVAA